MQISGGNYHHQGRTSAFVSHFYEKFEFLAGNWRENLNIGGNIGLGWKFEILNGNSNLERILKI